jgi:RimJ/RimL family protein N-acetyltransferase
MAEIGPTIETARLVLRPPRIEDFEAWAAFMADEEAARHLGGAAPRAVAWRSIAAMTGAWVLQGFGMFSVIERASGRWIGRIGPWMPDGWPGTEVGWGLARDVWGKGYAKEASIAAIDFCFDTLAWNDVIHCISPHNAPSRALAARLGSTKRGVGRLPVPFHEVEIEIWGQTREQWISGRPTRS